MQSFSSNTKLMLTGEYLALKGALSLALPLKFTQKLTVNETDGTPSLKWKSMINNDLWFYNTLLLPDLRVTETNNPDLSKTLCKILKTAKILNPKFLDKTIALNVTSGMDFNPSWGIGSSSSLISNIAYWADCDPFALNQLIFNGSGYDIACARSYSPIIYNINQNKPSFRNATFHPVFRDRLYFIYLNHKQNSKESVLKTDFANIKPADISAISEITILLESANDIQTFQILIEKHEHLIANLIHIEPVKSLLFNDFNGSIKSLGAWGGDFIMAASSESEDYVRNYFVNRNLKTVFKYDEIVLSEDKKM